MMKFRKRSTPKRSSRPHFFNNDDENSTNVRIVERYIFSKLEIYMKKPRLWQLTHSTQIKKRLLKKSSEIAQTYSLPEEFVQDSIEEFFSRFDKYFSKLRDVVSQMSETFFKPSDLSSKRKSSSNNWRTLELQRAFQLFPDDERDPSNEEKLLEKYRKTICLRLTPNESWSTNESSSTIFDLDTAYRDAEVVGNDYLREILRNFNVYEPPDVKLLDEIVRHSLGDMKTPPVCFEEIESKNFLSKISNLFQFRDGYRNGLRNMGDDFLILRFGKQLGPNALPNTNRCNDQFTYLVHLFLQSTCDLLMRLRTTMTDYDGVFSLMSIVIGSVSPAVTTTSVIKLENERFFSPDDNVDRWTWLLEKWRDILKTLPILFTEVGAFTRLIRTTIGIGIARIFHFAEEIVENERPLPIDELNSQLFHALQIGFYFGVAYAFVDCFQDEISNIDKNPKHFFFSLYYEKYADERTKTPMEIIDRWLKLMENILCGNDFDRKTLPKTPLTPIIVETHDALRILTRQTNIEQAVFNELALLLRSQRMDKKENDQFYPDDQLYSGAMLKSHYTYTCTTHLGNVKSAREESERLWIVPFLGQMTDDCRDFYDDIRSSSVTSFTHYASFVGRSNSGAKAPINPFYVFLHLCSDIYLSSSRDAQTGAFVGRRILRTLKSIEISAGESGLRQFLHIFAHQHPLLHKFCSMDLRTHFPCVSDPEKAFFRALNKSAVHFARTNRKLETYVGDHLKMIENALHIGPVSKDLNCDDGSIDRDEELLISAMNYSVRAGGKRLRPLLMMMVSDLVGFDVKKTLPLAQAIEYLHTSSLILDDLPAQDNSDLRRGQPTLHRAVINDDIPTNLCEGRAQLAAVDLIAVSLSLINENLIKNGFSSDVIIRLIREISASMHDLCIGQMMDLRAARMGIEKTSNQLNELDRIAWFKTGKAIEIALISPTILALPTTVDLQTSVEIHRIRELSRLMGILFQMRDDVLDIEGENLGKPMSLDTKNNTVTYVSTLGVEECRKRLENLREKTLKLVDECWPRGAGTIKDVVNYIVERKN